MRHSHQKQNPYTQNKEMQKLIKQKKPNANIVLSFLFISFLLISFLVLFAINGRDADDVSGRPTFINGGNATASPSALPTTPTPGIVNKVVILDAGHGGTDPGTEGSPTMKTEKELSLIIALKAGEYLKQLGITPIYTRTDNDTFLDLQNRVDIINKSNVPLTVSIHMNSYPEDPSVRGPEVYYYDSNASSQKSASVAAAMQAALNAVCNGRRSAKAEDYMVLREANMPAILIECGFLTCATEEANLNNPSYQDKLALAIANSIAVTLS